MLQYNGDMHAGWCGYSMQGRIRTQTQDSALQHPLPAWPGLHHDQLSALLLYGLGCNQQCCNCVGLGQSQHPVARVLIAQYVAQETNAAATCALHTCGNRCKLPLWSCLFWGGGSSVLLLLRIQDSIHTWTLYSRRHIAPDFSRIWKFNLWWGMGQVLKNLSDWKMSFHEFMKYLVFCFHVQVNPLVIVDMRWSLLLYLSVQRVTFLLHRDTPRFMQGSQF